MIGMKELGEKSAQWGVPSATVDKDWVLGHFLVSAYLTPPLRAADEYVSVQFHGSRASYSSRVLA